MYPTPAIKELLDAILEIQSKKEAENFFRDLLTIAELNEFSNRWQIVKRLLQKEPYVKIAKDLHVSTTTVSRVAHWLTSGSGGYAAIAKRIFSS